MVTLRKLERKDVELAGKVLYEAFTTGSKQHGFAPRMENEKEAIVWTWRMLTHQPSQITLAEVDGEVAGFLSVSPRGANGGIGPLAVHPRFQSMGIARQLMQAGLNVGKGCRSLRGIQEAYNPASFAMLYARFNFASVGEVLDLFAAPGRVEYSKLNPHVTVAQTEELPEICAYDLPLSRFDRSSDWAFFHAWGKVFAYREDGYIKGVLACLPNARMVQIGPLLAAGPEEALALIQHAIAAYPNRVCFTRVMAKDHQLCRALLKAGWRLYCIGLLVVHGQWLPGNHIEGFTVFPEGI